MSEEEPEAEDRLGKYIKDGVGDDLSVDVDIARSISNTPDDWVNCPENQSETSNGAEERGSLGVLALDDTTAVESELVDNNQVGNARNGVPSPFGALIHGECSEETSQDHDDISNNSDEDVSTVETSQEGEIKEEEWGGESPVDVAGPVDLTVDGLVGVGEVLLGMLDGYIVVANAVTDSHGEVGESSKGGDEGSQDMEQAFLDWDTESHGVERNGGDDHDDEHDPEGTVANITSLLILRRVTWDDGRDGSHRGGGLLESFHSTHTGCNAVKEAVQ